MKDMHKSYPIFKFSSPLH